jgi:hypothetical protein
MKGRKVTLLHPRKESLIYFFNSDMNQYFGDGLTCHSFVIYSFLVPKKDAFYLLTCCCINVTVWLLFIWIIYMLSSLQNSTLLYCY